MSELIITISINVPDGAQVAVRPGTAGTVVSTSPYVAPPPPLAELPPPSALPFDEPPHPADSPLQQAVAVFQDMTGKCPIHKVTWKVVPAGVSKKTGKPYTEFLACPTTGCNEKPGR